MVSVNYAAIGQRIKEKRKEAGLNQKELAAKVGERGRRKQDDRQRKGI